MLNNLFNERRRGELRDAIRLDEPIVFRRHKPIADKIEVEKTTLAGARGTKGGYASKWDYTGDSLRQWD